jgi:hypothetical protein
MSLIFLTTGEHFIDFSSFTAMAPVPSLVQVPKQELAE